MIIKRDLEMFTLFWTKIFKLFCYNCKRISV